MSTLVCGGCGGTTNTTTCDHLEHKDLKPRKCFVKWVDGVPEKGCGYDSLGKTIQVQKWLKDWYDGIIKKGKRVS